MGGLRRFAYDFCDFFMPHRCVVCGQRLSADEPSLCTPCQMHLRRIGQRRLTQNMETGEWEELHGYEERLLWGQLPVERVAGMFYYDVAAAHAIIHAIKYYGQPQVGRYLGRVFSEELQRRADGNFFDGIDAVVPMPLHWRRLLSRGYNQSEWIGRGVAEAADLPLLTDVVRRKRYTRSQTRLDHEERRANVAGSFRVLRPDRLAGRHLLIVDDVLTTGSSVLALGHELARVPGVRLSVLTLAWAHGFVFDA